MAESRQTLKHFNPRNYMEFEWSSSRNGRCGPSHLLEGRYDADGNRSIVFRLAVSKSAHRHFALIIAHIKLCDESKHRTKYVEIKCQLDATDDFYCRSYCLLNMFRAPLCPSSGARVYYTGGCCLWTHNPQLHTIPTT